MDARWFQQLEDVEREVVLTDYPSGAAAKYEICSGVEVTADDMNDDADLTARYVEAVKDLRHGLALAGIVGKMRLVVDDVDADHKAAARRAMVVFREEDLAVTWESVLRAHDEEAERAKRAAEHFQARLEFLQSQQREDGENITLGEARRRHQEGTEQLRRMLEGG